MKYILMMNTPEKGPYSILNWPRKDFEAHIAYWKSLNTELENLGELVAVEALTGPDQAKLVRAGKTARRSRTACFRNQRSFSPATGSSTSNLRSERMRSPPTPRRPRDQAGRH